jgi:putative ABC transport system permease protein
VWMIGILNSSVSYQDVNRIEPFRIDFWVLMLTLSLAIGSALVFALLPARTAADADVIDALKDSSHGVSAGPPNRRLRAALVVGELALSIVLVTAAVHLTRSALALTGMNRGLEVDRVMTAQLSLNAPRYDDVSRRTQFGDAVLRRLTSAAGIESASLVNYPPLSLIGTGVAVAVEGQAAPPGQEPMAQYWIIAPRYFETLGVPLLAGRDFTAADSTDRLGVAIVSQRFVEHFWGRGDAVGQHVTPLFPPSDAYWMPRTTPRPLTIVGVVGDVSEQGIPGFASDNLPQLYLPYSQNPTRIMTLVTRASGDPLGAAAALRDAVQTADPDQPTFDEKSLDAVRRETFARPREIAWLIGAFALLALVLSAIGVYGVMAYLATARTEEIRIRVVLGAGRADVVRLVVADGLKLTAAGVGVGVIAAPLALRAAKGWVFGVDSLDPVTLAAVAALLTLVAVAASAVPADRAARLADVSRSLG